MSQPLFRLHTFIRGNSAKLRSLAEGNNYCALSPGEALLLEPEPHNPKDASAIRVYTITHQPCGYIAAEHAPLVKHQFDIGRVPQAKAVGECQCIRRDVFVWVDSEGDVEVEEVIFQTIRPNKRVKEKIDG